MNNNNFHLIVYPAQDLAATKATFTTLLGVEPYADTPYYVGFRVGEMEIGLAPQQKDGPICYWQTEDLKARIDTLVKAGATLEKDVTEVGGGKKIALLREASGNLIGLSN